MKNKLLEFFECKNLNKKDLAFCLISILALMVILFIPTGFEEMKQKGGIGAKCRIIEIDNTGVKVFGLIKQGTQVLKLEVLNSRHKGKIVTSANTLIGKMELDTFYKVGDRTFTVIESINNKIINASTIGYYRIDITIILLLSFSFLLIIYAGFTGVKALITFLLTGILIWKVLLPGFLKGYNPVFFSLAIVSILTFLIIFLIAGFNKKGVTAFVGAISGVHCTCCLSILFGHFFRINGAVKPFSETLLYSGYPYLNLYQIFLAGIFIASSGAVMDIAMDVSASMNEIKEKHPKITKSELILSGFKIGRAVIGTMTTTLLLAYSGGYTAMLMVFIAQGTPEINIVNIQYVSAQILHTLVGSFGLVLVAPFTAIAGGIIYNRDF